jgi:hypothetical protein
LPDLEPHLALVGGDDEEHAVVLAGGPQLPRLGRIVADVVDRLAVERRRDEHRHGHRGQPALQLLVQLLRVGRRDLAARVDDGRVERRRSEGGERRARRHQRDDERQRREGHLHRRCGARRAHQKETFGAACDSGLAL